MPDDAGHPGTEDPTDLPTGVTDDEPEGDIEDKDQTGDGEETDKPSGDSKPASERYKGKTVEELIKILEDKDSFIDKRGNEVGDLRARIDAMESARKADQDDDFSDYFPEPSQPQQQPRGGYPGDQAGYDFGGPGKPDKDQKPDWDYDRPDVSTRQIVREELGAVEMMRMKQAFDFNVSKAKGAFKQGAQTLKKHRPLFDGIEKQVKDEVYRFYLPYVQRGQAVHEYLLDENVWIRAGQNIRLSRGEYDRLKPTSKKKPVQATQTEHPDRVSPDRGGQTPVKMDWENEDVKKFMKDTGQTREQAEKTIRKMQEDQSKDYSHRRIK